MRITTLLAGLCLAACSSSNATPAATEPPTSPTSSGGAATSTPAAPNPTTPNPGGGSSADAPEISRSVGARGAVVIFWPRVAPRGEDPEIRALAATVQQRLQQLAQRALPGRNVEVRPEPERVCPRAGCEAMTVGASLFHTPHGGCVVVALVSGAGTSPQRLIPWVGTVDLRETTVPFREPPEGRITARDMTRCGEVAGALAQHEGDVVDAIRAAAPSF